MDEKEESNTAEDTAENVPVRGNAEWSEEKNFHFVSLLGFDFDKLTEAWPKEKSSLISFKAHLRKNEFDISKIKVWELKGAFLIECS